MWFSAGTTWIAFDVFGPNTPQVERPLFGRAPLFIAAVAFAAGIVLAKFRSHPPLLWMAALVLLFAASIVLLQRRPWLAAVSTALLFLICGAFGSVAQNSQPRASSEILRYMDSGPVVLTAHVIRDGVWRDGAFGGKQQSLDVEVEQIEVDGVARTITGGLRLNVYPHNTARRYEGDDEDPEEESQRHPESLPSVNDSSDRRRCVRP